MAVAVLVAITLLPAVLSFAGNRVLSRRQRRLAPEQGGDLEDAATNRGFAWGRLVLRARVPAIVLGVTALAVLAIPVTDMRLAMPDDGTAPVGTTKRAAYDLVAEGFGEVPGVGHDLHDVARQRRVPGDLAPRHPHR